LEPFPVGKGQNDSPSHGSFQYVCRVR
jgi:hypothetical protein